MNKIRHKIVAVTPAGRRRYIEILSKYILSDGSIDEWHLWENCREEDDRQYLYELAKTSPKIKIIKAEGVDGTNKSINKFYKFITEEEVFYIRIDDDIVFMEENFGDRLYSRAIKMKDRYLWWSPLVINNALCTYFLFCKEKLRTTYPLTAQCMDKNAWGSPAFAEKLHNWFIDILNNGQLDMMKLEGGIDITMSRFSVNCIGFFGERMKSLGRLLFPLKDEEEWISATLPVKLNLPGRLVSDLVVSHFSFYTQEVYLLDKTKILQKYADIANRDKKKRMPIRRKLMNFRKIIWSLNNKEKYQIFPFDNEK